MALAHSATLPIVRSILGEVEDSFIYGLAVVPLVAYAPTSPDVVPTPIGEDVTALALDPVVDVTALDYIIARPTLASVAEDLR